MFKRLLAVLAGIALAAAVLLAGAVAVAVMVIYPTLPNLGALTDYRPKIPLRIYSSDGVLLGEFGEERRSFMRIRDVPALMKWAVLAAEDERFYQHGGVDYIGVLRAAGSNVLSGHAKLGASTITMQVARNFLLTPEKTFTRKFTEALLAFKIEHSLSKDQILELYFNQIYLGQRAYGFAAAAQAYFGKPLATLTLAEMAMLAGLPKAPSTYNPIVNPKRAKWRQNYVLRRMHELGYITEQSYQQALHEPLTITGQLADHPFPAQYVAEMARQAMYERYRDKAYTEGFRVITTIHSQQQQWAYDALRAGLMDFDRKHGYRGPELYLTLPSLEINARSEALDDALAEVKDSGAILPAIVLSASPSKVVVYLRGGRTLAIEGEGLSFAQRALSAKAPPRQQIRPGALIRVQAHAQGGWEIVELPDIEGAFVALDTQDGAIRALVGGFDFNRRHFNHVTQAWRQPGSAFKPFIYSAALERGLSASTMINDAPLSMVGVNGQRWEPKNDDGKFLGMVTMRRALTLSRNLVSVRLLMAAGLDYTQHYLERFGFSLKQHPAYLTMALGAGSVTPLQMAEAYATIANGGYRTRAYFIDRIEDAIGRVVARTVPTVAGQNAVRTLDARNAYIMTSMLKDVVRFGTAHRAMVLGRQDLAGKTGTTNDFKDAWFVGFSANLVAATWVGYDQPRSLGRYGYGGTAALPIWINYMANALKAQPEIDIPLPAGITVRAGVGLNGADEYYYDEFQTPNPNIQLNNQASKPEDESETAPAEPKPEDAATDVERDAVENMKDLLF